MAMYENNTSYRITIQLICYKQKQINNNKKKN